MLCRHSSPRVATFVTRTPTSWVVSKSLALPLPGCPGAWRSTIRQSSNHSTFWLSLFFSGFPRLPIPPTLPVNVRARLPAVRSFLPPHAMKSDKCSVKETANSIFDLETTSFTRRKTSSLVPAASRLSMVPAHQHKASTRLQEARSVGPRSLLFRPRLDGTGLSKGRTHQDSELTPVLTIHGVAYVVGLSCLWRTMTASRSP